MKPDDGSGILLPFTGCSIQKFSTLAENGTIFGKNKIDQNFLAHSLAGNC